MQPWRKGGIVKTKGLAIFGEGSPPEMICPVRCWDRALSAEEIDGLCHDPFAGFNKPIGVALDDSRPDGTVTVQLGGRLPDFSHRERWFPGTGVRMVEQKSGPLFAE
jgi:hypothetical protein